MDLADQKAEFKTRTGKSKCRPGGSNMMDHNIVSKEEETLIELNSVKTGTENDF